MAARGRLVYQGQSSLTAALLGQPDADPASQTIEDAQQQFRGNANKSPVDAIELMIADRVDNKETLPISNPEGFGAAQWIAQINLATLPSPMPRAFVLYLAKALADEGKYPTMVAALKDILANKTFV